MNITKIQQEFLKQLIANPERVKYEELEDGEQIFVTVTGAVAYILPADQVKLRFGGAQYGINIWERFKGVAGYADNLLLPTDEYRRGGTARKYIHERDPESAIYIDQGLLKNFDNPQLWQTPGAPLSPVVVTEQFVGDGSPVSVGLVCPVKVDG